VIAAELGIGEKTVETYRKHIMEKMQVRSLAELMKMVITYDIELGYYPGIGEDPGNP
jgi:FixJ family two-component response regulator